MAGRQEHVMMLIDPPRTNDRDIRFEAHQRIELAMQRQIAVPGDQSHSGAQTSANPRSSPSRPADRTGQECAERL